MLKIALILTLFLAILPMQACASTNEAKQEAKGQQPSPDIALVAIEQPDSTSLTPESQHQSPYEIRVISTPAKDGWDITSVGINALLAVVGIAGIVVALLTLRKIRVQATEMSLQRKAMEDTLGAINRQANLMEQQIIGADITAQKQLRAYVYIDSAALKFPQPGVPEAEIYFKNCGQTPAYEVRGWIHAWIEAHPLRAELPPPPANLTQGIETMAPGRISVFASLLKPPICGFLQKDLGAPQTTLYVYGEIIYLDAFGKPHTTKYRLIYGGPGGVRKSPHKDPAGAELWKLSPDAAGNEST